MGKGSLSINSKVVFHTKFNKQLSNTIYMESLFVSSINIDISKAVPHFEGLPYTELQGVIVRTLLSIWWGLGILVKTVLFHDLLHVQFKVIDLPSKT